MTSTPSTSSGPVGGSRRSRPGRRFRFAGAPGATRRVAAVAAALALAVGGDALAAAAPAAASVAAPVAPAAPAAPVTPAAPAVITPISLAAAPATYNLCVRADGSASYPTGVTGQANTVVPVLGYTSGATLTDACAAAAPTRPGGEVLMVDQGQPVTINVKNNLPDPTSMQFEGQGMVPDTAGIPGGGTKTYTFTPPAPGTYLYQAGLTAYGPQQVALGLYGALVVRPVDPAVSGNILTNQGYASPSTLFTSSPTMVLSELDTALTPANYKTFDMRNYAPDFSLINGMPFPATNQWTAIAGDTLLLRYVNAGSWYHSMSMLGANGAMVATDGHPLGDPLEMVAQTYGPGESADVLVNVPATTPNGTKLTLFEGSSALRNNGKKTNLATSRNLGGMMTFINVNNSSTADTLGPITSNVSYAGATGALSATIDDTATGGSTVASAEYFVDTVGANGTGTAMTVVGTSATATITPLLTGAHTIYVHGLDGATPTGNWGGFAQVSYTDIPVAGPASSAATVTPVVTNGSVGVAVHATADSTGGSNTNITGGEFFIDTAGPDGSGTLACTPAPVACSMTAGTAGPVSAIDGTIPAAVVNGLAAGPHTILIHAKDANNVWGATTSVTLNVDKTGPTASILGVSPSPNNGTTPLNSSTPAVRVTATVNDGLSSAAKVASAEMFLCPTANPGGALTGGCTLALTGPSGTFGLPGTGVVMQPNDGLLDATNETVYADIPMTTVNSLTQGVHTVYVRGRDTAGNYTATAAVDALRIDKTVPTLAGVTVALDQPIGPSTATVTLTPPADAAVNGYASGVVGGEYWINPPTGTAPTPGGGTPFVGTAPIAIPLTGFAAGSYTVNVRVKDGAGNWSTPVRTATFSVVLDQIFSNGFETGNRPWGWSNASTNTASRLNVVTNPALVGSRSLQAQGNNTNYVQYNFGGASNPTVTTMDARFTFRPNGYNSTGKDILEAASNTNFNTIVFRVRYRLNGTQPQVQLQGSTTNPSWVNVLAAGNNTIEVVRTSATSATLYVNGISSQTVTTGNQAVTAFRLGSVTNTGTGNGVLYFDNFTAKRSTSPLLGP